MRNLQFIVHFVNFLKNVLLRIGRIAAVHAQYFLLYEDIIFIYSSYSKGIDLLNIRSFMGSIFFPNL